VSLLSAKWLGLSRVSAAFNKTTAAIGTVLGVQALEKYFLEQTKERFLPKGAAPNAQIGPDGTPWAPPSPVTIERRKSNRNAAQAMFDTGQLYDDITVLSSRSVGAGGKGFIKIGLKPSSTAREYIDVLENGGLTPQGRPIPPRPVFGTGEDQIKSLGASMFDQLASLIR
jgi:hypothetical protein